jgi:predicted nucleic acid-binding protein
MHADSFLDTNVLLYAISKVPSEAHKAMVANHLMATEQWGLSVQVCQEFYVAATQKFAPPISSEIAENYLRLFALRPLVTNTPDLIFRAIEIQRRNRLSFGDASVLAAAKQLGTTTLFTEDFSDGQIIEGIRVINLFHASQPK